MEHWLFVDDDEHDLELLKFYLKNISEITPIFVNSAQKALDLLNNEESIKPAVIVTDRRMGLISGIELAKQIHRNHRLKQRIDIYLLSGWIYDPEIVQNRQLFSGVYEKPNDPQDIIVLIRLIMDSRQSLKE